MKNHTTLNKGDIVEYLGPEMTIIFTHTRGAIDPIYYDVKPTDNFMFWKELDSNRVVVKSLQGHLHKMHSLVGVIKPIIVKVDRPTNPLLEGHYEWLKQQQDAKNNDKG